MGHSPSTRRPALPQSRRTQASNYVSLTATSTFLGVDMQFIAHTSVGIIRLYCRLSNSCEESYSQEGIATWIPYSSALWLANQELGITFIAIALGFTSYLVLHSSNTK